MATEAREMPRLKRQYLDTFGPRSNKTSGSAT